MRIMLWLAMGICGVLVMGGASRAQDVKTVLAPSGTLRIAVYAGSPTSLVKDRQTGEARGVAVEAGAELARRLGIPHALVILQRPAEVLKALQAGEADVTITNATAERAKVVDFGPPVLALELGFLVREAGALKSGDDLDKPDVVIGVSKGSTSEKTLPQRLTRARIATAANLEEAAQMLQRGDIAAFATNKAVLFDMADKAPGTKVLEARWGVERLAIAIPKGRDAAHATIEAFSREIASGSFVKDAAARAGLRGLAPVADEPH